MEKQPNGCSEKITISHHDYVDNTALIELDDRGLVYHRGECFKILFLTWLFALQDDNIIDQAEELWKALKSFGVGS